MNETIQIFRNEQFGTIRTIEENGKVLFCGSDIARTLGYTNPKKAIADHCRKDGVTFCSLIDSMGREQQAKFISEGNVYRLITHSKLPAAEKFEKWVFDEVLPSIRKTGGYGNIDINQIVAQTAAAVASEIVKQLAPFFAAQSKPKRKPTGIHYPNQTPSKIDLLNPEVKERADEMLLSGNYSCRQVANFIINETGNYISVNTVTRYKREKLSVVGSCEQERFFNRG